MGACLAKQCYLLHMVVGTNLGNTLPVGKRVYVRPPIPNISTNLKRTNASMRRTHLADIYLDEFEVLIPRFGKLSIRLDRFEEILTQQLGRDSQ